MSSISCAGIPLASINNETMGGTGIAIMAIVIVICLSAWLIAVFLAARHPSTNTKRPTPTTHALAQ